MSIGHKSGVESTPVIDAVVSRVPPVARMRVVRATRRPSVAMERMARSLVPLIGRVDEVALDPARAAQVEILRNAVAAGRYRPDLREVAWKLLCEVAAARRQ